MTKKIVRLAMIRSNESSPCPFGLPIASACGSAGQLILRMAPLESSNNKRQVSINNNRVLVWGLMQGEEPTRCAYANKVFEQKNAVECSFGDNVGPNETVQALNPSSGYTKMFHEGLSGYPLSQYPDYNISRNSYYGITSLAAGNELSIDELKKLAKQAIKDKNNE